MAGAPRWTQATRIQAAQVTIGDVEIGRARLDIRWRIGADAVRLATLPRVADEIVGAEIRIPAGRALRDKIGRTTAPLQAWTRTAGDVAAGEDWFWMWFAVVEWRQTCCRLLGYADMGIKLAVPKGMAALAADVGGPEEAAYMAVRTPERPPE